MKYETFIKCMELSESTDQLTILIHRLYEENRFLYNKVLKLRHKNKIISEHNKVFLERLNDVYRKRLNGEFNMSQKHDIIQRLDNNSFNPTTSNENASLIKKFIEDSKSILEENAECFIVNMFSKYKYFMKHITKSYELTHDEELAVALELWVSGGE